MTRKSHFRRLSLRSRICSAVQLTAATRIAVATAITVCSAVAIAAEEPPRITLELEAAPVTEVLPALARVLDRELEAPESDRTVTTTLVDVRPLTALQVVCDTARCEWALGSEILEIEWLPSAPATEAAPQPARGGARHANSMRSLQGREEFDQAISMSLREAALDEVLESIGRIAGVYVAVDPKVEGDVTIELQSASLWKVLERICAMNDCTYELDLDGETLRVLPADADADADEE